MWNQQQDEKLRQLATEAQDYPAKTRMRQIALTKLVKAIRESGQLCRPHRGKFIGFYEEIYDEACNRVFLYLCQNIDKYDPNKGEVLQWFNFLLRKRFPDAVNSILGTLAIFPENSSIKRVSIDELDQLKYHHNNPLLSSELIACGMCVTDSTQESSGSTIVVRASQSLSPWLLGPWAFRVDRVVQTLTRLP
ncbi:MAG: hypothetical protein F6K65_22060 [Moorea sp. SIO3C2]|nr:hypothetical protein [Moorena sp. SIO3C2]